MSIFVLLTECTSFARASQSSTGQIIYVDGDASGFNDGSSWTDAYNHLQDALASASYGDEIYVAQGIYTPDRGVGFTPGDKFAKFSLKNGVALRGGFAGFGESDPNSRNIDRYKTTLSGDLSGNDIDVNDPCDLRQFPPTRIDNSYTVLISKNTDQTAILDGFTITAGYNTAVVRNGPTGGAGMFNQSGNPVLVNCTFTSNAAVSSGGAGLFNLKGSNPTLENCTFTGNYAVGGAGIYNYNSDPNLTNCIFFENFANSGGAIYNLDSNPIVTGCTFNDNHAQAGGAVCNTGGSPRFEDCTFASNTAIEYRSGGAMINIRCTCTAICCTFFENAALSYGGAIDNDDDSTAILVSCVFIANQAHKGGAVSNGLRVNCTITDCIFRANRGGDGGGVHNHSGAKGTFTHCRFDQNTAQYRGGGINNESSKVEIISCIFNKNSASEGGGGLCNFHRDKVMLSNCVFIRNNADKGGGIYSTSRCESTVANCIFSGNFATEEAGGVWNHESSPTIVNCTFYGNLAGESGGGMASWYCPGQSTLTNCIFWRNNADRGPQIALTSELVASISHCNIEGGIIGLYIRSAKLDWREGNINTDPCFANPGYWDPNGTPDDSNDDYWVDGDYHLKSQAGRWDPVSESWIQDDVTSPCIDAGDPNSLVGDEPFPNGGIINMGTYGGTAEASKSPAN